MTSIEDVKRAQRCEHRKVGTCVACHGELLVSKLQAENRALLREKLLIHGKLEHALDHIRQLELELKARHRCGQQTSGRGQGARS